MVKPSDNRGSFCYPDPLWSQNRRWSVIGNYKTAGDFIKFFTVSDNYLRTYKGIMDGNGSPNTDVEKVKEYYRMILLDQGYAESQLYKIRGLL